jgi:hypothetical protein
MKTKLSLAVLAFVILFSSLTFAQTDTVKIFTVKRTKVEIGNYYEVLFHDLPSIKGKLLGVNKTTILVLADNRIEEIEIEDIKGIENIKADAIVYTTGNSKKFKPIYSISAGYSQRSIDDHYSYSYSSGSNSIKFAGFNILGDALMKTSDNFGFKIDLNYIHTFGKKITGDGSGYYNSYDSTYYHYNNDVDYTDLNAFTIKPGICFGSMSREDPFNFYINVGLGFGWLVKSNNIYYNSTTKNGVTTTTQSSYKNDDGFLFGVHAQIRFNYKIAKDYSLFAEPTFQYWSTSVNSLFSINGGVTFLL